MCGEKYDVRVDFCFADGTPLELVAVASSPQSVEATTGSALEAALNLDAPEPGGFSMFDAPEPDGFDADEQAAERGGDSADSLSVDAPPVAAVTLTDAPEAGADSGSAPSDAVRQEESDSRFPVGFHAPPSATGADGSDDDFASDGFFDEAPASDDLDFPDGFGADDGYEFTEPTIPAPRRQRAPNMYVLFGVGALAAGLAIVFFLGGDGGSSDKTSSPDAQVAQQVEPALGTPKTTIEPVKKPGPGADEDPGVLDEPLTDDFADEAEAEGGQVDEENVPLDESADGSGDESEVPDVEEEPVEAPERKEEPKRETPKPKIVDPPQPKAPPVTPDKGSGTDDAFDPWATEQPSAQSLVTITSSPSGATLYVDSRMRGKTPTSLELTMGAHSIRLQKDGYVDQSGTIQVEKARQTEKFRMAAEPRRVTVNCYGPDKSKVYLGGQVICAIPGSGSVMEGEHTFRVVTPDKFFKRTVRVKRQRDGAPTPLSFRE